MLWDKRKKRKQTRNVVIRKKLADRVWEEKYEMHYKELK